MSAQGLGCMGMSQSYGEADEATSIATLHRALEQNVGALGLGLTDDPFSRFFRLALADRSG